MEKYVSHCDAVINILNLKYINSFILYSSLIKLSNDLNCK